MDDMIRGLVKDWDGFEELVAKLHDTGSVKVTRKVVLEGTSGAPREIDVLVKHREGLYEHLIIIECKHWGRNVSRLHVDALHTTLEDLNASRGVIFTTKAFQRGAKTAAKHFGIDLYRVRELQDSEWGPPGRVIDFFIQYIQRSIGNLQFHNMGYTRVPTAPVRFNIHLDEQNNGSETPTFNKDGAQGSTLESLLILKSKEALDKFTVETLLLCGGEDCIRYMLGSVNYVPSEPIRVLNEGNIVFIPKITFDLGIKIQQERIIHDRAKNSLFVLAVENCVRDGVTIASRKVDAGCTTYSKIRSDDHDNKSEALKNGSVLKVTLSSFFAFEEMANLKSVTMDEVRRKRNIE